MNLLGYLVIFFFSFFQQSISKSFSRIQPIILNTFTQIQIFDFQASIFHPRFFDSVPTKIVLGFKFLNL